MHHQVCVGQTEIRKLQGIILTRHHAKQRSSIFQYIVGQRKHELLRIHVYHAERKIILVSPAEKRIELDILEVIIDASVVPLQTKSEAFLLCISSNCRIPGRLLRDGDRTVSVCPDVIVQIPEELNVLKVLIPSVHIRDPLPIAPAVVQIQHTGEIRNPQAIRVILRNPEHRA